MKGFPNQINDLGKLARGMRVLARLVEERQNARDDAIFGRRLVLEGVAGTGHHPMPPAEYLQQQERRPPGQQSHRTTARGLRELYRMLGFIVDTGPDVHVGPLGHRAAALTGQPASDTSRRYWHDAFWNLRHDDVNGVSHPYRVLLRLLAHRPRISRAKCALALEARNDSVDELVRIAALADLNEAQIRAAIDVTHTTWANATKILPAVALQVRSIQVVQNLAELRHSHGTNNAPAVAAPIAQPFPTGARPPRQVTPETIATLRKHTEFDEGAPVFEISPENAVHAALLRLDRLQRHQAIVQRLARPLHRSGAQLYEDPFDLLAVFDDSAVVFEVKTLTDDQADERERVREAFAQLCYYQRFHVPQTAARPTYHMIACFERPIRDHHRQFLQQYGIAVIWQAGADFAGDPLPVDL